MPSYVCVVRRGRVNSRVLLPNGMTTMVLNNDLTTWDQINVTNTSQESSTDDHAYIGVVRRGRNQTRLLLPDGNTQLISNDDLPQWHLIESALPSSSPVEDHVPGFRNPESQDDRLYIRIIRRGSRNISVLLRTGNVVRIPQEFFSTWLQIGSPQYRMWEDSLVFPQGRAITDCTFGVELEFVADYSKLTAFNEAMKALVGEGRYSAPITYGSSSVSKWVLGRDGSVRPTGNTSYTRDIRGFELTSPILHFNDESRQELASVLRLIITVFDGVVNRTCGTHIHIGGFASTELRSSIARRYTNLYGRLESSIFDTLVSPSRRADNNRYCMSNLSHNPNGDRYHKINTCKLDSLGTIENRQHQGTLDIMKIWSWMELNAKSILSLSNGTLSDSFQFTDLQTYFDCIGLSSEAAQFFMMRRAELND